MKAVTPPQLVTSASWNVTPPDAIICLNNAVFFVSSGMQVQPSLEW
jgi:hypothetical protein